MTATVKISALPAGAAVGAADLVPMVQGGTTVQQPASALKTFCNAGVGTVTSVALAAPAEFSVSGSPVTGAGALTFAKASQSANLVWAGPTSGGAAAPTFRGLVAADLPAAALSAGASRLFLAGKLAGANFNSTADQAIALAPPAWVTNWIVAEVVVANPSTSLTAAQGAFYAAASKTNAFFNTSATTSYANLTAANRAQVMAANQIGGGGAAMTYLYSGSTTIYLSLTTAQGGAATADVYVIGMSLD